VEAVTYSIVARDPRTGELGIAVQSHWFAAGGTVPWAEAGVGAVATQAFLEMSYGPRGLDLLREGASAPEALERLTADDPDADVRQVGIVDARGGVATHTGERTIPAAGHVAGADLTCQANMMWQDTVWDAMAAAYSATGGDLVHRLLAALDAAEGERGDIRGRQAAGILIVGAERSAEPWRGVRMHLHVDDHPDPNAELRRLVEIHRAYEHLERSEELELEHDAAGVQRERDAALAAGPALLEVRYWAAIGMATEGRHDEALALMASVDRSGDGWRELLRRLVEGKLMDIPPEAAARLLEERPG
jgi:uncharacterized Ntn-hydrolase superfamily protein